jgi:hypothetical protein
MRAVHRGVVVLRLDPHDQLIVEHAATHVAA